MGELIFQSEAAISGQFQYRLRASAALSGVCLGSKRGQLPFDRPADSIGTQPRIVHIDAIHAGSHSGLHCGQVHLMIVGREVRDHRLAVTVIRLHLFRGHSRLYPHGWIRIGLRIELLYVRPFATEANALEHALALQQLQHVGSDTFVLDVQNQPNIFFPRKAQRIFEERDSMSSNGLPSSHLRHEFEGRRNNSFLYRRCRRSAAPEHRRDSARSFRPGSAADQSPPHRNPAAQPAPTTPACSPVHLHSPCDGTAARPALAACLRHARHSR